MTHDDVVLLGDTPITVRMRENGEGTLFLRLHENESTAGDVGRDLVCDLGGTFIDIIHGGERAVSFTHDGCGYRFDPNRIFSDVGLKATLQPFTEEAATIVRVFREKLLSLLHDQPVIVLHNNEGKAYDLRSYLPGGSEYMGDGATFAHIAGGDARNFAVTTRRDVYDHCAANGISAAYQVPEHEPEDGSLSKYYGSKGCWYANVEAAYEAGERQYAIARALAEYHDVCQW